MNKQQYNLGILLGWKGFGLFHGLLGYSVIALSFILEVPPPLFFLFLVSISVFQSYFWDTPNAGRTMLIG